MTPSKNIKGVRIQTVNLVMLALSLIMFIAVLYTTIEISREYSATMKAITNYMEWEKATRSIQSASDYLTEQVMHFVSTKEKEYADNYFNELYRTKTRENALEALTRLDLHNNAQDHNCDLKKAVGLSNALAHREIYAIRLMADALGYNIFSFPPSIQQTRLTASDRALDPEGKIARAQKMIFDTSYQTEKKEILTTLSRFLNTTMDNLRATQQEQTRHLGYVLNRERIMLMVLCFLNVLTFIMIIVLIVRPLKIYLSCIQNDSMLEAVGAYEFKHLALTYNDVFALKEHHDKMLRHKAEHDPLTGLYNRAAYDSLRKALSEKPSPVGLLLVDVDKFKSINDTYGHKIGDITLCNVADQLAHNFRAEDYCIRLGGDEFAVIFNVNDPSVENIIKGKIRLINQELLHPEGDLPPVSLSVGGAISKSGFSEELYEDADKALYKVKEGGRCGCQFYHPANENNQTQNMEK